MCVCTCTCLCVSLAGKCCGSYCQTCAGGWRSTALMASDLMVLPLCCTITMALVRLLCVNLAIYEWLVCLNHFIILSFETRNAIFTTNSRWLKGKANGSFVEKPDWSHPSYGDISYLQTKFQLNKTQGHDSVTVAWWINTWKYYHYINLGQSSVWTV